MSCGGGNGSDGNNNTSENQNQNQQNSQDQTPNPNDSSDDTPAPTPTPTSTPIPDLSSDRLYVGYYESWSEPWVSSGTKAGIAQLPPYFNVVILAFMQPDATYSGNLDLTGTGIQYTPGGLALKEAILTLKTRNPATKVLIAVGGATYWDWDHLNADAIERVVQDFGFDGVDIDYEPSYTNCQRNSSQKMVCDTDALSISIVHQIRSKLPRPFLLSIAAWSIGAYGEGNFADATPAGDHTGMLINLFRSSSGSDLDLVNIMSYDASSEFDPRQALLAYKSLFTGKIVLGVEISPEAWPTSGPTVHNLSINEVNTLADFVLEKSGDGMMIWSIQKRPNGTPSATNPTSLMVSQAICRKLNLGSCDSIYSINYIQIQPAFFP
jgi:chitinase